MQVEHADTVRFWRHFKLFWVLVATLFYCEAPEMFCGPDRPSAWTEEEEVKSFLGELLLLRGRSEGENRDRKNKISGESDHFVALNLKLAALEAV